MTKSAIWFGTLGPKFEYALPIRLKPKSESSSVATQWPSHGLDVAEYSCQG
jgi:hypothetical protein